MLTKEQIVNLCIAILSAILGLVVFYLIAKYANWFSGINTYTGLIQCRPQNEFLNSLSSPETLPLTIIIKEIVPIFLVGSLLLGFCVSLNTFGISFLMNKLGFKTTTNLKTLIILCLIGTCVAGGIAFALYKQYSCFLS